MSDEDLLAEIQSRMQSPEIGTIVRTEDGTVLGRISLVRMTRNGIMADICPEECWALGYYSLEEWYAANREKMAQWKKEKEERRAREKREQATRRK